MNCLYLDIFSQPLSAAILLVMASIFLVLLGIEELPDLLFCSGLCMRGTRYSGTFLNQGTLSQ